MAIPISNVTRRQVYAPSGAGGAGPYAFTFEILANTDIAVYKDDTLLTLTTHYTVTINANGTGSVTITAAGLALAPVSPTQYAIVGNRTIARSTDFTTGGDFFANTINDELDQQTIFAQQNAEGLQRALVAPQTDPTTIDMTLPRAADRANKTLAFDANGDPTLGISAADVANAVTYATNAANSATAAASSASSASSSASSASSSASTASTQASNASTSATSASNSASSASTSATNAASSASTATTQASNASTSATNAASSASAASTSASNAATSETNAAASASTASTQASNAATSASSAASSAAAAAAALDSFDDRYLGSKTSAPTLDNDGNALVTGALYYDSVLGRMYVYDGAAWIAASSAQQAALVTYEYVATAGQTSFSGSDANGATLSYIAGGLIVSLNGAILRPGDDYTATNGTSIVLVTAASLNDELCAYAFSSFTVANAVAKTGDTMNGALIVDVSSTNAALRITQLGTGNALLVEDSSNPDSTPFVIDASGYVVAGYTTSSPATLPNTKLVQSHAVAGGAGYTATRWDATANGPQVILGKSRGGAVGTLGIVADGDTLGQILFTGDDGTDLVTSGATITAQVDGTPGTNDMPGRLVFSTTADGASSPTERMRIDSAGNVGIGTSSPTYLIEALANGSGANLNLARFAASSAATGGSTAAINFVATSNLITIAGETSDAIAISTASTERMRVISAGDVGINNTNPTQYVSSGKTLNLTGTATNSGPANLYMSGSPTTLGSGFNSTEVFSLTGITAATEITRITGTGSNGYRAYFKITITGHTSGVANGVNIKEFYWDGSTSAPVQISTYTANSPASITFDNSTSNVCIIKVASANGTSELRAAMKVEWLIPPDFSSNTWTIS